MLVTARPFCSAFFSVLSFSPFCYHHGEIDAMTTLKFATVLDDDGYGGMETRVDGNCRLDDEDADADGLLSI